MVFSGRIGNLCDFLFVRDFWSGLYLFISLLIQFFHWLSWFSLHYLLGVYAFQLVLKFRPITWSKVYVLLEGSVVLVTWTIYFSLFQKSHDSEYAEWFSLSTSYCVLAFFSVWSEPHVSRLLHLSLWYPNFYHLKDLSGARIYGSSGSILYPTFIFLRICGVKKVRTYVSVVKISPFRFIVILRWLLTPWFAKADVISFTYAQRQLSDTNDSIRSVQSFIGEGFYFDVTKRLNFRRVFYFPLVAANVCFLIS